MIQSYTYLLINFFTVIICFVFSFDKRIRFDVYFRAFSIAALLTAIPFIAWDVWFTAHGVWWFNKDYTIGVMLAGLPVEEWLFLFVFLFPAHLPISVCVNFSTSAGLTDLII
ncbi:lycopene cyclase domain-containing protein [Niabella hibiscisoli]|uniref:lycopene cyclase domain-containing protein n=1 Tax=Niabella hibiscisoli TaxID=1825928 RepID=UPI00374D99FA